MDSAIKFTIPEGYILDKEHSTDRELVYKPSVPVFSTSWEEFCEKFRMVSSEETFITLASEVVHYRSTLGRDKESDRNLFPSRYGEALLALMQLLTIREKEYITPGWVPKKDSTVWGIVYDRRSDEIVTYDYGVMGMPLTFPTKELAKRFLETWKPLLEKAKELI